jgi:hypothetical protein
VTPTPCNEDLAVGEQGRRVPRAAGVEAARSSPRPTRGVVELRARESAANAISTPCNEDLAVGQQGGGVIKAGSVEATRGVKCKRGIALLRDCRLAKPRYQTGNDHCAEKFGVCIHLTMHPSPRTPEARF